jgi:hypothetical protein
MLKALLFSISSVYKKKKIMKDREEAIKNGLSPLSVEDGTAEKHCITCHNEESPVSKDLILKRDGKRLLTRFRKDLNEKLLSNKNRRFCRC